MSAEAFLNAEFPPQREQQEIERELKRVARGRAVTCMHAEIVWRVRRGEEVTAERMVALWPIIGAGLITQYIDQLRSWGVLAESSPVLQLAEAA
jgi:hypothetical protein